MTDTYFMIDSNALAKLSTEQRASPHVRKSCRIPEEVLHEARFLSDVERLRDLRYPTTARVLEILREVMASVQPDDRTLVDLYANRGNADPLVVACAIDAQRESEQQLFPSQWLVASDDNRVREKATEFQIGVVSGAQLLESLDLGPV